MIAVYPFTQPHPHRRRNSLLAVAVLACSGWFATPGQGATPARPTAAEIEDQVRQTLPAGWSVQTTATAGLPTGWQSHDATAVTIQVSDGHQASTVCVVPLDWVGVQVKGTQVDSVRFGRTAKVIVPGGAPHPEWLANFAPANAALTATEGTTNPYAGQYIRVEAEVRTLLRKGGAPRELAVASFIALGVPAEDAIRDAALDSRNPARLAAIRSLRHFPGKSTREALAKVIVDRSRDAAADTCRIAALDTCAALLIDSHGPAVVTALQQEKDEATTIRLAAEINRLRYAPAAAELRRWLKNAQSIETKVACARAQATIRDVASAAEIRAVLDAPPPRRAAVAAPLTGALRRQLTTELHRLAGTWGPDSAGARLSVVVESPDRVLVYVENMGPGPLRYIPHPVDGHAMWPVGLEITLDGSEISPPGPRDADLGNPASSARMIAPGSAACFELQLPQDAAIAGDHRVAAGWFGLTANEVILRSGAVVSLQDDAPAS